MWLNAGRQYQLKPIWELNILESLTNEFIDFMNRITNAGADSGVCGNIGIPAANSQFWISDYKTWNVSNFSLFWDDSICFDQYMIGLTMLKTGDNVTTIEFGSFCEYTGNLDISFVLQMIQYNTSFGIKLSYQTDYAFTSYF